MESPTWETYQPTRRHGAELPGQRQAAIIWMPHRSAAHPLSRDKETGRPLPPRYPELSVQQDCRLCHIAPEFWSSASTQSSFAGNIKESVHGSSPHIAPRAAMIAPDFAPVRTTLASRSPTGSIAPPTVEGACARTGAKDKRGPGQRGLYLDQFPKFEPDSLKTNNIRQLNKRLGAVCG